MSDLHISKNRPFSTANLLKFCEEKYPRLLAGGDVLFLAITGDFTDGISDFLSFGMFGQQEGDWQALRLAMAACEKQGLPILTIRGNHDSFGVESFQSESNKFFSELQTQFRTHSKRSGLELVASHKETGSYALVHKESGSRHIFLEGSRIVPSPHQFHGEFSVSQEVWLKAVIDGPSNHGPTFVFMHYPLGSLTPDSRERLVGAAQGAAGPVTYLSGHIHSVIGKRGVQSLNSYDGIDELQLSDFKWSGVVRKVDISSAVFVDIPTIDLGSVSASLLLDPVNRDSERSLVAVYSELPIDSVSHCDDAKRTLRPERAFSHIHVFSGEAKCLQVSTVDKSGKHATTQVVPVDNRLFKHSVARWIFAHWFESLQLILLTLYVALVIASRQVFLRSKNVLLTIYLVTSPLIPTTLWEGVFNRKWIVSNGVAMFDLETRDIFLDPDTTRIGPTMLVYLFFALAINWRLASHRSRAATIAWTVVLVLLTLVDARMIIGRGGLRSVLLSPHTAFLAYVWWLWNSPTPKVKTL